MRSIVIATLALVLAAGIAHANDEFDQDYREARFQYGWVMSKAEFCDLDSKGTYKNMFLTALSIGRRVDVAQAEKDFDLAYQLERDRQPKVCDWTELQTASERYLRAIDQLFDSSRTARRH